MPKKIEIKIDEMAVHHQALLGDMPKVIEKHAKEGWTLRATFPLEQQMGGDRIITRRIACVYARKVRGV